MFSHSFFGNRDLRIERKKKRGGRGERKNSFALNLPRCKREAMQRVRKKVPKRKRRLKIGVSKRRAVMGKLAISVLAYRDDPYTFFPFYAFVFVHRAFDRRILKDARAHELDRAESRDKGLGHALLRIRWL